MGGREINLMTFKKKEIEILREKEKKRWVD